MTLKPLKVQLLEHAFAKYSPRSFADIGACWGVDGGYTFHLLDNHRIDRALVLDGNITNATRARAKAFRQLELVEGELGDEEVQARIRDVEAVILFDVLLHQVKPDWDRFLRAYAARADVLIIYNQNYVGGEETVRFVDGGLEFYLENTPYEGREETVRAWFARHEEPTGGGKIQRDAHSFWQWGIVLPDLVREAWRSGFRVDELIDYGPWPNLPTIRNQGLLAARRRPVTEDQ